MSDDRRQWHMEKSVSLGHIITTLALLMTLIGGYTSFSERIAVIENQQASFNARIVSMLESQRTIDSKQDGELLEIKRQTREDLRDISRKLDNLIQRQIPQ